MVLPNGYTAGPRKFTKLLKPALAALRKAGITLAAYLDDIIILGRTIEKCRKTFFIVLELLQSLGFVIHPQKSIFVPSTVMEFLGFIIDSNNMTVTLTEAKKVAIKDLCTQVLTSKQNTIRDIARLLGKFSSSFIGVPEGKLHFRWLERNKTKELARRRGKFDKPITLTREAKSEITWWKDNILTSYSPIIRDNPSVIITTDASLLGWGACWDGRETGGLFSEEEKDYHINVLETKAVLFGLSALCGHIQNQHIKVLADNTATVGAINNMGSSKSSTLHSKIIEIWDWVLSRQNWLTASHIPGILNVEADEESRKNETKTEWKLNSEVFNSLSHSLHFVPTIDLFASRINTQLPRFFAFRPDPDAEAINAFSMTWTKLKCYAFPPFICIDRVLQKIRFDKATGILVVPDWPNQNWYHMFSDMIIYETILFPRKDLLYLPNNRKLYHPLHKNLRLRAALVTGTVL